VNFWRIRESLLRVFANDNNLLSSSLYQIRQTIDSTLLPFCVIFHGVRVSGWKLIIFAYASIPSFSFAETKVYDKDWNLQKRIDDNGRIYDKDWNVTGKIQNDKIYDKDWNLKYRVRDDKIYDKDWNLKGRIDGDKIYDKAWNRKGTIRK